MVSGVLAVLGRLWIVFLTCIRGAEFTMTTKPTILPLATKRPVGPQLEGTQNDLEGRAVDTNPLEAWQESKQQFLRHPSLRRSMKRPAGPKPDKGKKKERLSRFVPPTFIQDWTYIHAKDSKPPRRPPRPPSGPVPAVIVTPCTPTMSVHPVSTETPTPAPRVSPLVYTTSDDGPTIKSATRNKPARKSSVTERDIAELKVELDDGNLFGAAPSTSAATETPRRSFTIPESLKGIGFDSLHYSASVLSAVSDMLCDEPSWASDGSPMDCLVARAASYITSTPAKRRLETLVEEDDRIDSPQSNMTSSPLGPQLSDAQMDLLPYPDVFDLDMYYGMEPNRLSIPRHTQSTSSQNRHLSKEGNRVSHASSVVNATHDSPRSAKRFGYMPESQAPKKALSPIHEVKRYRDHYRHPAFTCPPSQASPNTSIDSLGNAKQSPQSPRTLTSRALTPIPLGNISNRALPSLKTPTSSTAARSPNAPATISGTKSDPLLSPIKERGNTYPPPPIVVISHHRFSSFSVAEESRFTVSEGSQELRARLREACDNFSKSVWTDESYSLEAVSLN